MKKLLTLFALLLSTLTIAFGQETTTIVKDSEGNFSYEKVFEANGKSKEEIFNAVKSWVIKNIKTQSNTNYFDEAGKVSISTAPVFPCRHEGPVDFKLNIEIKDGKYRVTATSFIFHSTTGASSLGNFKGNSGGIKGYKKWAIKSTDEDFAKMIASIQDAVNRKSDW